MLLERRRKRPDVGIPTSSMADIAFLLLIFFLVTTTMSMDKGIGMVLPPSGSGKEIPKKNICHIWINAAGEIALEGNIVSLSSVQGEVKRRVSENPNLIVSLKSDRKTAYEVFVDVLDELKLSGSERISIASPEE
ncbi:MAG: biopolymer transporter ExbD [Candidatus Latescibacterota bacterium]